MRVSDRIPIGKKESKGLVRKFQNETKNLFHFDAMEKIGEVIVITGPFYSHRMVTSTHSQIILQLQSWISSNGNYELAHNYLTDDAAKVGHELLVERVKSGALS
ncbi:MAG: hypothetical protein Harvfovirus1_64 [Harvfovirus sp.]|uniref:Uncharacterized protein n=1 Tax=Harvfovirus sp. TaxID=2487768 RepID=A0A3G5A4N9_9VIRU|nr:MAG: hypothetical protein Harvfovirus1_64 [Harvfovirus sp.]